MPHHKLTLQEREIIAQKHYAGESDSAIGKAIGRHRTTVSRELK